MTASALRALLASGRVTHVPGVYDPATAALAVAAGHRAVHLSGAAVAATMLGRPDLGFVHATQIADRASTLVPAVPGIPLLADADAGFRDPDHAVWTALAYRRAGISGLVLRDAAATIRALADQAPELVIIARTGAATVGELAAAGADVVLLDQVRDLGELSAIHRALPRVPLAIEVSEAATNPPSWTEADLAGVGVRLVLHPLAALLAAMRAASVAYRAIAESGTAERVERLPWAAFTTLTAPDEARDPDAGPVPANLET